MAEQARTPRWLPLLRDTIVRDGEIRWHVEGASMLPTLPPGTEIVVVPLARPPRLGEILLFMEGEHLVVHRLVRRLGDLLVTQGDGRLTPDRPLRREQLVGRVVAANLGPQRHWPGRLESLGRSYWLLRYQLLRLQRRVARERRRRVRR